MAKTEEDAEVADRIRAHLRQQMADRQIDRKRMAMKIGADIGNFSRQMNGERGFSAGQILRICRELSITPTRLLTEDPPAQFWREGRPSE